MKASPAQHLTHHPITEQLAGMGGSRRSETGAGDRVRCEAEQVVRGRGPPAQPWYQMVKDLAEVVGNPPKERRVKQEAAGSGRDCMWARSGGRCDEGWLWR